MRKKKSILNDIDNREIVDKIIDLCLWYQIEDSHRWLDIINVQIESCRMQLSFLEDNKPFWFQKKKLEEHNKNIEALENKIVDHYKELEEEVEIIQKMKKSLGTNNEEN